MRRREQLSEIIKRYKSVKQLIVQHYPSGKIYRDKPDKLTEHKDLNKTCWVYLSMWE